MTRLDGLVITRENRLGQDYAPRDDPNYSGDDRNWMGFLRSVTELFGGAWATGFTLSASQDRRRYTNWPDGNDIETTDEYYRGRRERITFDNMLHLPDAGFISNSNLVFGFGTENEAARSRTNSDGAYGPYSASLDKTQQNNFAYIGTQHRFWERLDITTALRQDAPEGFDGATTWRLGGVLALPEIASRLRASGGTAYRAPALEERYGSSSSGDGPFRGNPDLRPERSTSWEAGIETDIADGLTLSALYFESKIRDLIKYKYLSPGPSTLENIDRAHIQGGEFGVNWRLSDSFSTRAAWTVQEARDEAKDTPLKRRPRNSVSLSPRIAPKVDWVDVPNARLIIAPDFIYVGRQWDTVYPNEGGYGSNGYNDEGFVFNMTASLPITQQLTAFIEARNLGNRRYEPANGFVIPGRSAILGLRGVF
jgi:vitamin B12 transporter